MGAFPIVSLGIGIIACVILYQFLRAFHEMNGCWKWPSAEGRIIQSGTEMRTRTGSGRMRRMQFAKIVYEYRVNGKIYQSSRIYFGPEVGGTLGARKVFQYPEGRSVLVRYNPQNPVEAVLERNAPALLVLFGIVALITVLCILRAALL